MSENLPLILSVIAIVLAVVALFKPQNSRALLLLAEALAKRTESPTDDAIVRALRDLSEGKDEEPKQDPTQAPRK